MIYKEAFLKEGLWVEARTPLARYTTFRVGGEADLIFKPRNFLELWRGLEICQALGLPTFFLGGGSNLLVRDGGIRGVVVSLKGLKRFSFQGETLEAEAGAYLPEILALCLKEGFAGLEFLAGVPSTLGGAVVMNAGAFGQEISDVLEEITVFHQGGFRTYRVEDLAFSYRSWNGPSGAVVVKAKIKMKISSPREVQARFKKYLDKRKRTQPLTKPSAGCFFKNPPEVAAGYLIEEVGLKGFVQGRAGVSEKHANFIVNLGGARASEILALAEHVKEEVFKAFGIELKEEVTIVGES